MGGCKGVSPGIQEFFSSCIFHALILLSFPEFTFLTALLTLDKSPIPNFSLTHFRLNTALFLNHQANTCFSNPRLLGHNLLL